MSSLDKLSLLTAKIGADQAEKSSHVAGKLPTKHDTPKNSSDENMQVPATPPTAG